MPAMPAAKTKKTAKDAAIHFVAGNDEMAVKARAKELAAELAPAEGGEFAVETIDAHADNAEHAANIIRDRAMDDALGRVYLPEGEVARAEAQARGWLGEGADYCAALPSGRLRYATLLPALLGLRTLGLSAAQPRGTLTPAKVSRAELRRWMCRSIRVWFSANAVMPLVRAASK